jgi:hypothetical protein
VSHGGDGFHTDKQRRWWFATLDANGRDFRYARITEEEREAIEAQTFGGEWKALNEALREGATLTADQQKRVALLDAVIAKGGHFDETVYRGVSFGRAGLPPGAELAGLSAAVRDERVRVALADYAVKRWQPGAEFELGGYQSTARNVDPALDASLSRDSPGIVFEIRANKGLPLRGVQSRAVDDEDEILLPRTTRYRVRRVIRSREFERSSGAVVRRTVVVVDQVRQ